MKCATTNVMLQMMFNQLSPHEALLKNKNVSLKANHDYFYLYPKGSFLEIKSCNFESDKVYWRHDDFLYFLVICI